MASEPADFGDDFGGMRLLTVGRICPQKGYDLAVPAVARLISEGYPIRWYIIGQGDDAYAENLRAQIAESGLRESVVFMGMQKNPYKFMKAADIYFQPSRHEGKPIAVEEAKVLCRPIFVTDYTSAAEQTENGTLGLVGDISEEGIYRGLKKLLDDGALREILTERLAFVTKNEKNFSQIMALLE